MLQALFRKEEHLRTKEEQLRDEMLLWRRIHEKHKVFTSSVTGESQSKQFWSHLHDIVRLLLPRPTVALAGKRAQCCTIVATHHGENAPTPVGFVGAVSLQ